MCDMIRYHPAVYCIGYVVLMWDMTKHHTVVYYNRDAVSRYDRIAECYTTRLSITVVEPQP